MSLEKLINEASIYAKKAVLLDTQQKYGEACKSYSKCIEIMEKAIISHSDKNSPQIQSMKHSIPSYKARVELLLKEQSRLSLSPSMIFPVDDYHRIDDETREISSKGYDIVKESEVKSSIPKHPKKLPTKPHKSQSRPFKTQSKSVEKRDQGFFSKLFSKKTTSSSGFKIPTFDLEFEEFPFLKRVAIKTSHDSSPLQPSVPILPPFSSSLDVLRLLSSSISHPHTSSHGVFLCDGLFIPSGTWRASAKIVQLQHKITALEKLSSHLHRAGLAVERHIIPLTAQLREEKKQQEMHKETLGTSSVVPKSELSEVMRSSMVAINKILTLFNANILPEVSKIFGSGRALRKETEDRKIREARSRQDSISESDDALYTMQPSSVSMTKISRAKVKFSSLVNKFRGSSSLSKLQEYYRCIVRVSEESEWCEGAWRECEKAWLFCGCLKKERSSEPKIDPFSVITSSDVDNEYVLGGHTIDDDSVITLSSAYAPSLSSPSLPPDSIPPCVDSVGILREPLCLHIHAQFNCSFIVCSVHDCLYFVDQHAADEAFNFEDLCARITHPRKMHIQTLVVPICVPMSMSDEVVALEWLGTLEPDKCSDGKKESLLPPQPHEVQNPFSLLGFD
ncbi:DNA mismatch repair protein MutL/Mlh/Pms like protein, partial [Aduncisulcus paluster]